MPPEDDPSAAERRIVEARLRLRDRFLARMRETAGMADQRPLGSGPPNRHGMPKVPVGQTPTAPGKWPVLDLGRHPAVSPADWRLRVDGACRHPFVLDHEGLMRLEQIALEADFHCVTGWSKLDLPWVGVRLATAIARAEPLDSARFVLFEAYDGYTTNLPLEEALKDDVLLAHTVEGRPLAGEHGGPVRVITPQLYAWKGAKWIRRLELSDVDRPGLWEVNGYSNSAHPWRDDRYAR